MEIKSEYNSGEGELGTCSNCCSRSRSEKLKTRLMVKTEETDDGTTTVREAVTTIYGSELQRFGGTCLLCVDCCEILTQLYHLFIQFRDRYENGSDVLVAGLKANQNTSDDSQGQDIMDPTDHFVSSVSMEDERDDSRFDNVRDDDDEQLLWRRRRSLRRKLQRRPNADTEFPELTEDTDPIIFQSPYLKPNSAVQNGLDNLRDDSTVEGDMKSDLTSNSSTAATGYPLPRGRGRPKGSKNRVKYLDQTGDADLDPARSELKKRRGRPPKKIVPASEVDHSVAVAQKRKPGRPRKNEVVGASGTVLQSPNQEASPSKADENEMNNLGGDCTVDGDGKSDLTFTSSTTSVKCRGRPKGSKNRISYFDRNSKTYNCPHCGKQAKTPWNLSKHIRSVHERLRPYECSLCPRRFAGNEGLVNHMRVLHADSNTNVNQFVCPVKGCGKSFPYRSSLHGHAMVHDRQLWNFECEHCHRKCRTSTQLSIHKSSHSEDRNFACEDCGALFKQATTLRNHRRYSHPEKYSRSPASDLSCRICQKSFKTPWNMRLHIRTIHDQVKTHQCHLCGKQFSGSSNMKSHLTRIHGLDRSQLLTELSKRPVPMSMEIENADDLRQELIPMTGQQLARE